MDLDLDPRAGVCCLSVVWCRYQTFITILYVLRTYVGRSRKYGVGWSNVLCMQGPLLTIEH